ncbi:MAG: SpoIIE family protein phosphatase [Spirochaetes bacterium]|nr:SpoIIE family protein phosphatase [Spirochaetota bacterium]
MSEKYRGAIMKTAFRCLIFMLCAYIPSCKATYNNNKPPRAIKGVLDLSTWDLEKDGVIPLSGQWEFYWMRAVAHDDFLRPGPPRPDDYIEPGSWNNFALNGTAIGGIGFATYRLKVLLDGNSPKLALKIKDIQTSYTLYINGTLTGSVGKFGRDSGTAVPQYLPRVFDILPAPGDLEIIVNVANFSHYKGGMSQKILLGTEEEIRELRERGLVERIFIFGVIFIMGFFHIFIYLVRKKDTSPLYIGLFCVTVAVYMLLIGEGYLVHLFPGIPWNIVMKMIVLSYFMAPPFFVMYWNSIYPAEFPKTIVRITQGIAGAFSLLVLFTRPGIFLRSLPTYNALTLIGCGYLIYVLILAAARKREGARVYLAGFILLSAAVANDILYDVGVIPTGQFISEGLFVFLFFLSMMLAVRSAWSFASIEKLSKELETQSAELLSLNVSLEHKVGERTKDLEKTQGELKELLSVYTEINDNLYDVTRELEHAQNTMQQDMEMAASVQERFFSMVPPSLKGWDLAFTLKPIAIVSGDCYDFYLEGERLTGVSLFDVSGHGVASGLITMLAKSISFRHFTRNPEAELNQILKMINEELIEEIGGLGNYISGIMLRFSGERVDYVNAGHPDIMLKSGATGQVETVGEGRKDFKGMFLGVPFFRNAHGMLSFDMRRDDAILLYSDAIVESSNKEGEQYGFARLLKSFDTVSPGMSAREQLDRVIGDFNTFLGDATLSDDLTVIIVKKTG